MAQKAAAKSRIPVTLARPTELIEPDVWSSIYTYGAAQTERKAKPDDPASPPKKQAPVGAYITDRNANQLILDVIMPENPKGFSIETWRIVTVVCNGKTDQLIGYGVVTIEVTGSELAWSISFIAFALFWLAITFAAWRLNAAKLQRLWRDAHGATVDPPPVRRLADLYNREALQRLGWKFLQAANPIFVSQDSLGYGSLSRLQILVFTSVVGIVLLYIFVHSGELSPMSNTVLMLLGITVAGGAFARAAGDWSGISAKSRRFLLGEGILIVRHDKPRFADTLETHGEIDVAKVQAFLFTNLVALYILVNGVTGLGGFELPQQIVYLTGISQTTYVFGKFLLPDTLKRLEQDLEQLRTAAANLLAAPGDPQLSRAFDQAKRAAASTLAETYLDRFNPTQFSQITPDKV